MFGWLKSKSREQRKKVRLGRKHPWRRQQELVIAAVHLLTMATSYTNAHENSDSSRG
jgi:hypothetical protein